MLVDFHLMRRLSKLLLPARPLFCFLVSSSHMKLQHFSALSYRLQACRAEKAEDYHTLEYCGFDCTDCRVTKYCSISSVTINLSLNESRYYMSPQLSVIQWIFACFPVHMIMQQLFALFQTLTGNHGVMVSLWANSRNNVKKWVIRQRTSSQTY